MPLTEFDDNANVNGVHPVIMKIDIEIELLTLSAEFELPAGYLLEERGTRTKALYLRCYESAGETIDETVSRFLSNLQPLAEEIVPLQAILRVAVFYDVAETVVFPFYLAKENVRRIALFDLSLEASIYVCSEDE